MSPQARLVEAIPPLMVTLLRFVKLRNEVTYDTSQAWLLSLFPSADVKKPDAFTLLWIILNPYSKRPLIHASLSRPPPHDPISIPSELTYLPNWIWMDSLLWFVTAFSEANRHRQRHKRYGVLRESQALQDVGILPPEGWVSKPDHLLDAWEQELAGGFWAHC